MKNITVYSITSKPTDIESALRACAFQSIDDAPGLSTSVGFVSYDDFLDFRFKAPVDVAHYTRFTLRMDTRKVQPAVFKKHLKIALDAEKAATGKVFLPRARKLEIAEQVRLRLMVHTEPKPEFWPVVIDNTAALLFLGCTREKVKSALLELLGGMGLSELTPMELSNRLTGEPDTNAGGDFLTHLLATGMPEVNVEGRSYLVAIRDKALANDENALISAATLNGGEIGDAFQGRVISVHKGRVVIEGDEEVAMTVNREFAISGLKLPKIDPGGDDPDGEFLERMFLVGRAVECLHQAFTSWLAKGATVTVKAA